MARWRRYVEIYALGALVPIFMFFGGRHMWHLYLWSFGGREEYRRLWIQQPIEEQWYNSNPRQVFFRDAPLSAIPKHLTEKSSGDPEAKAEIAAEDTK